MFCTNCGNKLLDGENFCPQCGMKVANDVVPQPAPQPTYVQPAYMQPNVKPVPVVRQSGGISVLSIIGFSLSVLALFLSIVCMSEFYDYYGAGLNVMPATFVSILAEASLGLSIAGVIIASKKNHRLKPMGIVGIPLGAVATLFMMIIMFEIGFILGTGIY